MNKVMHFELPAEEMDRAARFYERVFGWKINRGDKNYYLVNTVATDEKGMPQELGGINGGIQPRNDTAQAPILVIQVPDLEAALKKVEEAGGTIVMPKVKIENILYYARVEDTEGNVIGLGQDLH